MKTKKRLLNILLSLALVLGLMPAMSMTAYADNPYETFTFSSDKEFSQSGTYITITGTRGDEDGLFAGDGDQITIEATGATITEIEMTIGYYSDYAKFTTATNGTFDLNDATKKGDTVKVKDVNAVSTIISAEEKYFVQYKTFTVYYTASASDTYEVTYKVVNGTWSDDSTTEKKESVQSGSKPANVPTGMKASSGYTGGSWDTNPADTTITGAKTFTYTFTAETPATHTVTFDPANGGETTTTNINHGDKATALSIEGITNGDWTIHNKEYNNGWHKKPFTVGKGTFDFAKTPINEDADLTLVWESIFTVTVNNGNMGKAGYAKQGTDPVAEFTSGQFTILKDYDYEYSFIAEPYEGYRFVRWVNDKGQTVSTSARINYDCTAKGMLTAHFTVDEDIIVTLDANGGTTGNNWPAGNTVTLKTDEDKQLSVDEAFWNKVTSQDFVKAPENKVLASVTITNSNGSTTFETGKTGVYTFSEDSTVTFDWVEDKFLCSEGDGQSHHIGSSQNLEIVFSRTVNDKSTFDLFKGIKVDNAEVAEKSGDRTNYTANQGSVKIELQSAYLDTLSEGKHTLTAVFADGKTADATFTITKKSSGGGDSDKDSSSSTVVNRLPKTGVE